MHYQPKVFQASPHRYRCCVVVVVADGDYGYGGFAAKNVLMTMLFVFFFTFF